MATTQYLTIAEAQVFYDEMLDTEAWDSASDTDKNKALKMATRSINSLNFIGDKTSTSQANAFPRDDEDTPDDIYWACVEIALAFLDGVDTGEEIESLLVDRITLGNVSTSYNRERTPIWILAGIPNSKAWAHLKPYLRDWNKLEIQRG